MRIHSLYCPIYHDPMFYKEDDSLYTEEEWKAVEAEDLITQVTYELFYDRKDGKDILLDIIEAKASSMAKYIAKMLEPVEDEPYISTWGSVGNLESRVLLYNSASDNRRLKDDENQESYSDITYFLMALKTAKIRFEFNRRDLTITLSAPVGGKLAHLKPCCPHCNTILPDKWFNSVGYYKISVLAPPVGGKTTLLSSWMINSYEAIRKIGFANNCNAVYGLADADREFPIQKYFRDAADQMYHTGNYPGRDEQARKPPIYTRIIHYLDEVDPETGVKEEYLLVGSYDIAGETLKSLYNRETSQELVEYLDHMNAFIYLISPSQLYNLSCVITDSQKEEGNQAKADEHTQILVWSLDNQAEFQRKYQSKEVTGEQLLNGEKQGRDQFGPWDIYHHVDGILLNNGTKGNCHIAYTIVKSDQLEKLPELADFDHADILFKEPSAEYAMDERYIFQTGMAVKELIERFAFKGTDNDKKNEMAYFSNDNVDRGGWRSVSWHCVSASAKRKEFEPYRSIRRVDPLIGCLQSEFRKLGWS